MSRAWPEIVLWPVLPELILVSLFDKFDDHIGCAGKEVLWDLLDITGVGTENGYNKEILDKFEDMKDKLIIAGGLNKESIGELDSQGIKKVLVGTSLHSGEVNILD